MERSQTVWLVLDAGRLMRAQVQEPGSSLRLSKLDHSVNAALSLAQVAVQCGDRAGLLAYGSRPQCSLMPAGGLQQVRRFVDALAEVRAESTEPDHARAVRMLLARLWRRSLVDADFMKRHTMPEVIESTSCREMTPPPSRGLRSHPAARARQACGGHTELARGNVSPRCGA